MLQINHAIYALLGHSGLLAALNVRRHNAIKCCDLQSSLHLWCSAVCAGVCQVCVRSVCECVRCVCQVCDRSVCECVSYHGEAEGPPGAGAVAVVLLVLVVKGGMGGAVARGAEMLPDLG